MRYFEFKKETLFILFLATIQAETSIKQIIASIYKKFTIKF